MQPTIDGTVNLIDNDPAALNSTRELVRSIGMSADAFLSLNEFLQRHDANRPGCLVADLGIPATSGIEILRELNTRQSPLPAVFVASHANVADTVKLMQLGAVTLLEKPYRDRTLIDAIQSAVRLDAERRMVAARRHELDERVGRLSEDEKKVLDNLVAGKTNKRIAFELGIACRTVEYRRHNIFSKLEVQSVAEMTIVVTDLERLTDISQMSNAPAMRLTDSRFTSLARIVNTLSLRLFMHPGVSGHRLGNICSDPALPPEVPTR